MNFLDLLQFVANPDSFYRIVLLLLLIVYTLFALILTFQIFSFNRLVEQAGFASFFKLVAIIHVSLSFILLIIVVLSL